jgi:hypothetical protein
LNQISQYLHVGSPAEFAEVLHTVDMDGFIDIVQAENHNIADLPLDILKIGIADLAAGLFQLCIEVDTPEGAKALFSEIRIW